VAEELRKQRFGYATGAEVEQALEASLGAPQMGAMHTTALIQAIAEVFAVPVSVWRATPSGPSHCYSVQCSAGRRATRGRTEHLNLLQDGVPPSHWSAHG
jgi:hypothetical protein